MDVLDYELLVRDFESRLVTQLRGHGTDTEYLEMWVPDDDPVKSLLNMIEAAAAFGRDSIAVRVTDRSASERQIAGLVAKAGALGDIAVERSGDGAIIRVTGIRPQ